jgi:hypothetical protein
LTVRFDCLGVFLMVSLGLTPVVAFAASWAELVSLLAVGRSGGDSEEDWSGLGTEFGGLPQDML